MTWKFGLLQWFTYSTVLRYEVAFNVNVGCETFNWNYLTSLLKINVISNFIGIIIKHNLWINTSLTYSAKTMLRYKKIIQLYFHCRWQLLNKNNIYKKFWTVCTINSKKIKSTPIVFICLFRSYTLDFSRSEFTCT